MSEIISREEALSLGLKYYFTADPCRHGHLAKRYACNKQCLECVGVNESPRRYSGREQCGPAKYARLAGETRYFTGKPCVHGHISERMAKDGVCVECIRINRRSPKGKARKREQLRRQRERFKAMGLTAKGRPRKRRKSSGLDDGVRQAILKRKQRLAYRALIELGIEI